MNERNLLERTKKLALTFNVFMEASFVPGRLIVNKIKAPPVHAGIVALISESTSKIVARYRVYPPY
jgi:hypothetical protein